MVTIYTPDANDTRLQSSAHVAYRGRQLLRNNTLNAHEEDEEMHP